MRGRRSLALVAAGAMATTGAGVALAETTKVDTTVDVGLQPAASGDSIGGRVKAKSGCKRGRDVTVTYRDESAGIQRKLGTDKTDRQGKFSVPVGDGEFAAPGDYTAVAKKMVIRKDGDKIVCKVGKGTYEHTGGGGGPGY